MYGRLALLSLDCVRTGVGTLGLLGENECTLNTQARAIICIHLYTIHKDRPYVTSFIRGDSGTCVPAWKQDVYYAGTLLAQIDGPRNGVPVRSGLL
jgi:hypothetical protein